MRSMLKVVSALGLALTIVPSLLLFIGAISWNRHAGLMALGMVLWFASAPFWMKKGGQE